MKKFYFALLLLVFGVACSNAQDEGKTALAEKVNKYLQAYQETGFSGTILMAEGSQITLNKGFGYINDSTKVKASPQSVWTIGSITKPLTALAILKLEMLEKLKTSDPIKDHIEGLKGHIGDITIHQLLTHTSGLTEYSGRDNEMLDTDGFIEFINNSQLKFSPGETFAYSNVGYTMLGIIIEKVSGLEYEEFLKQHVFDPAGMSKTGYILPNWDENNFAVGYTSRGTWGNLYQKNGYKDGISWNLKGNGGIMSTAEDIYKLYLALRAERILSKEAKEKMYGKYIQAPGDFSPFNEKSKGYYGFGWGMTESAAFRPIIMHGGSNDVFEAAYMYYPEDDVFYFIASNRTSKNAVPAILAIDKIISNKKYDLPKAEVIPDEEITKNLEGEYTFPDGSIFTIVQSEKPTLIEGSLTVRPLDKQAYLKIIGEKIDGNLEQKIEDFIKNVVEKGAKNDAYSISVNLDSKPKSTNDEGIDIVNGTNETKPLKDQLNDFWEEQLAENGTFSDYNIWGTVGVGDRYWVQARLVFEKKEVFINFFISQDDGEIKRFSNTHRPVGLLLKPKTTYKYQEVNSGGFYEFIINKSGSVKIKTKLKGEKLIATKTN